MLPVQFICIELNHPWASKNLSKETHNLKLAHNVLVLEVFDQGRLETIIASKSKKKSSLYNVIKMLCSYVMHILYLWEVVIALLDRQLPIYF